MYKALILFCALLILADLQPAPATAGRATAYARAKAKGRMFVHRPYYKAYKGRKKTKRHAWFALPSKKASAPHKVRQSRF
ncbi:MULTISPECIES: hypothetical protein [Hymenobacter]|uniref:Uncharacterized protein n=1 Tax=Hymenobacter jejuensis TaxID=2502781 RepID=A0A5B8A5B2_9BACT|nr:MULTISPECIES: hypothetical protein [Hymenobacter]MBC6989742.1 hypothetical protein [Hymenobacter sp. BT491]QDA61795.1 hypothetical protein FHG12_17590 [Hymenobacter jejuensis]